MTGRFLTLVPFEAHCSRDLESWPGLFDVQSPEYKSKHFTPLLSYLWIFLVMFFEPHPGGSQG